MSNPYDPNSNPYGGSESGAGGYGPPAGGGYGPPAGGGYGQGGGGYGSPYGQPPGPYGGDAQKTDPVSIIAFVLSLTCCLSVVGAIMGFVGLGRTKNGQRKGRWAAVSASIIGILGTLAAIGIGAAIFIFVDSVVTLDEAKVGVCVNVDDDDNDALILTEKDCDEEHDAEIVYAGDAGDDAGTLETGDAGAVCEARIRDDTPEIADVLDQGGYRVSAVIEDPDNVGANDTLVCYAEPTSGSLDEKLTP